MQLAAAHRREVIEDLLDIQIFSTMNVILKNKVVENNESLDRNYKSLEFVNEKIKVHETYLKSITQDINDRKSELTEKIKRLEEDREIEQAILDENLYNLNQLTTQTTGFSTLNKKLSKIVLLENQLNDKIRKLEKDKDFFVEHDNCPTCNQIIDAGFKEDTVQKKLHLIGETSGAVEEILKQRKEVENSIKEITAINNQISSVNIDVGIRRNKIKNYKDNIKELQTQVDDLSKKISSNTQDNQTIKELETQRDNLSSEIKKNLQMKEVYRASALILKDSGIKSRIIKQYIPIINKLINKYLASMDFFVQFELDETFNETIKSRYRDVFSYASFSEGEKSKIDLALLFTWRQISKMRNSASTNILILDEVFDGSLDGSSSDELLKILMELSKDSNIIVISHKTDQLQDKFDRVMKFEKKQNFSRMIEV
jgi:DNA repair exonuclease SbcCD ATPase subunit